MPSFSASAIQKEAKKTVGDPSLPPAKPPSLAGFPGLAAFLMHAFSNLEIKILASRFPFRGYVRILKRVADFQKIDFSNARGKPSGLFRPTGNGRREKVDVQRRARSRRWRDQTPKKVCLKEEAPSSRVMAEESVFPYF